MKVLIYAKKSILKNIGGPQGYLYNINEYLKTTPDLPIYFLPEENFGKIIWDVISRGPIKLLLDLSEKIFGKNSSISFLLFVFYTFYTRRRHSKKALEYYNQFDFIHVHDSRKVLTDFYPGCGVTSKIILTSHCPEPLIDEMEKNQCPGLFARHPKLRNFLLSLEAKAYDYCDNIMFPVREAREPYENVSLVFKEKFAQNEHKFFYVPTALNIIEKDKTNNHVIDSLNISQDALKICYIGRHNSVKGYDFLQECAVKLWQTMPNVHFIIGGKEEPLKGLSDPRWHELGWVKTSSLLNEVDVFVLPNMQTYFDLILLEVLRQGTPVVLSRTGGNKWFENKNVAGMFFYDDKNAEQLIEQLNKIKTLKENCLLEYIKTSNMLFFQQEFNMHRYINRYLESLKNYY